MNLRRGHGRRMWRSVRCPGVSQGSFPGCAAAVANCRGIWRAQAVETQSWQHCKLVSATKMRLKIRGSNSNLALKTLWPCFCFCQLDVWLWTFLPTTSFLQAIWHTLTSWSFAFEDRVPFYHPAATVVLGRWRWACLGSKIILNVVSLLYYAIYLSSFVIFVYICYVVFFTPLRFVWDVNFHWHFLAHFGIPIVGWSQHITTSHDLRCFSGSQWRPASPDDGSTFGHLASCISPPSSPVVASLMGKRIEKDVKLLYKYINHEFWWYPIFGQSKKCQPKIVTSSYM
jgi:hypothetical protein